jgi:hypothetical protein
MALPVLPIPLEWIIGVITGFVLVLVLLIWFLLDIKRFAPEAFVIRWGRKNDQPVLLREQIGTGLSNLIKGEKDGKNSPIFKDPHGNEIYIDPSYLHNTRPQNWGSGLMVYHYATSQYTPLTTINALGLNKCVAIGRKHFPELDFLKDKDLMAFAKMRRDHLSHNVEIVLRRYQPEYEDGTPVQGQEVVNAVIDYQEALKKVKIDMDAISAWDAAFEANPTTHQISDLGQIVQLIEQLIEAKWAKKFQLMTYVIMFCMVAGIVGIVIYVISMAK